MVDTQSLTGVVPVHEGFRRGLDVLCTLGILELLQEARVGEAQAEQSFRFSLLPDPSPLTSSD